MCVSPSARVAYRVRAVDLGNRATSEFDLRIDGVREMSTRLALPASGCAGTPCRDDAAPD
jgi:hypothetical protein